MKSPLLEDTQWYQTIYRTQGRENLTDGLGDAEIKPLELSSREGLRLYVFKGAPAEPHFLYFPAEFDTAEDLLFLAAGLGQYGYTLAVVDLTGAESFHELFNRGKASRELLKDWMLQGNRNGPMVVMGRSVGTAAALDVACSCQQELLCLILESAFHTTKALMKGLMLDIGTIREDEEPFCNKEKMSRFEKPVLFIHSQRDEIIPVQDIEWLVCESRSKASQFQIAGANSRNCLARDTGDLYFQIINNFINLRLGRRPKRRSWRERSRS